MNAYSVLWEIFFCSSYRPFSIWARIQMNMFFPLVLWETMQDGRYSTRSEHHFHPNFTVLLSRLILPTPVDFRITSNARSSDAQAEILSNHIVTAIVKCVSCNIMNKAAIHTMHVELHTLWGHFFLDVHLKE